MFGESGRVVLCCVLLLSLLLTDRPLKDRNHGKSEVTCLCTPWDTLALENGIFVAEKLILVGSSKVFLGDLNIGVCLANNGYDGCDVLLFSGNWNANWNWNVNSIRFSACSVYGHVDASPIYRRRFNIRRHGCPCAYYSNTCATFQALLIGDLVFKLNPGPVADGIPTLVSARGDQRHSARSTVSRNASNLINVYSSGIHLDGYSKHPLSLCLLNAGSVKNKAAELLDYLYDSKTDLFAITETWLTADDAAVRAELGPDGYSFMDHPRVGRRGGGTGLIYRDSLCVKKVDAGEKDSFEFSEWTVHTSGHNLRLVIIYRPPYSSEHRVSANVFFREFSDYLESIVLFKEKIVVTGDFNIHLDNGDDPDTIKLLDLLESVGLRQHVTQPTHVHGHILDLVITRSCDHIIKVPPIVDQFISDHASLLCKLLPDKPPVTEKVVTYRKHKSIDLQSFKSNLAVSTLCKDLPVDPVETSPEDVDKLVMDYNSTLSKLIDHHAPLKSKIVRARSSVPWYTAEINASKRLRRKAERTWRRTGLRTDFNAFKAQKNHVTHLMNVARRDFYTNFINENSTDQGRLFRATKKLLAKKEEPSFPDYHDKSALANDIGHFFVQKIKTIRSEIEATTDLCVNATAVTDEREIGEDKSLCTFQTLTESDVQKLILKSARKYCALDPMPTSLVVSCLDELLPVITRIINSSLSCGYFPNNWKEALVIPLLKKSGLVSEFTNLRPVSNLQFVSKLTERAVFEQMHSHMTQHSLYPSLQSAYRKCHSTETALLKVQNDILMNMDHQHVTLLVLLDLSAAFDTVDHKILLDRLKSNIGIKGIALKWFTSYLSNRSQRVSFGQNLSHNFQLPHGVPQGSCLGPLLFTIYASKLFEVIERHLPQTHAYADDTQLYLSFKPDSTSSQTEAMTAMELCIKDIRSWMIADRLKLNDKKTEFMLIGTRHQLSKVNIDNLCVGDTSVPPVAVARNLGTWFDRNMSMVSHINKTCKATFFHLYNIRQIRKYLTNDTTKTLVHAFIMGRIDYCNSLLFGLPAIHISKLQRIQNAAARLVQRTSRYSHITPVLYFLHWLPVTFRIEFKLLIITFKAIHGQAPDYISSLVQVKKRSGYNLRSNSELLLMPPSTITKKTMGDRAFAAAAPALWNKLPCNIRSENHFERFKISLKTYLFRKAFECYDDF